MPKTQLTDADRVVMAAAAGRENGLVLPTPKSLKLDADALEKLLRKLVGKKLLEERAAQPGERAFSATEDGTRLALVISELGLAAIGAEEAETVTQQEIATPPVETATKRSTNGSRRSKTPANASNATPAEKTTKLSMLVAALRQRKGATIDELMEVTGWQAHSVRGSISGALKKRMSLNVVSRTVDGRGRVYRIEAATTK